MGRPVKPKKYKVIKGFIPVEVDWNYFIMNEPVGDLLIDGLNYILVYMTGYKRKTLRSKKKSGKKKKGIPISSNELKSVLSLSYHKYIKYLTDKEIIVKVENYSSKKQACRYDFPEWFSGRVVQEEIEDHWICVREQRRLARKRNIVDLRYPYLSKWFNSNLNFDYISYTLDRGGITLETRNSRFADACHQSACLKLHNKDFSLKCDDYSGRLHTNLTNLKSKYRNYLSYSGNGLISIDLKNSQPFFLAYLLFLMTRENSQDDLKNILKFSDIKLSSTILKTITEMQVVNNLDANLISFTSVVSSGQIYEHFGKLLTNKKFLFKDNTTIDRNFAKETLIHFLFSHRNSGERTIKIARSVFENEWPNLFIFLQRIKINKRILPLLLQSIERHFIIEEIAQGFSLLYPDAPLYSIHDSLVTTSDNSATLQSYMYNTLKQQTGISPTLKTEQWKLP